MSSQKLTAAQRLGIQPLDATRKPALYLKKPNINDIARAFVQNLPADTLFRRGAEFVTVERSKTPDKQGLYHESLRPMTARRLRSWAQNHFIFLDNENDPQEVRLSKDLAEALLASDPVFDATPELGEIAKIRMPVWTTDANGKKTITLSSPGYNPQNGVFTVETLSYLPEDYKPMPPAHVRAGWTLLMHSFPWRPEAEGEETQEWQARKGITCTGPHPCTNRSSLCALALMLGQYCRYLFSRLPMGMINGNQPGTGKSLLAWYLVAPAWGLAQASHTPRDDAEMIKLLNTLVKDRSPYIMLDDIGHLVSNAINMFATSPEIIGRNMGSDSTFKIKNTSQIIATGNGLNTSPDIERRSLIIDLYCAEDALTRTVPNPLTKETVSSAGYRVDLLRFLWSMVANWREAGCPTLVKGNEKPSFEDFAEVVGSIMVCNGFPSPFAKRVTDGEGGDLIGRAIVKLLSYIAGEDMPNNNYGNTHQYRIKDILDISDELGYTETIAGGKEPRRSLGNRLKKLRGRKLLDTQGRSFMFGKGEDAASSFYTFKIEEQS